MKQSFLLFSLFLTVTLSTTASRFFNCSHSEIIDKNFFFGRFDDDKCDRCDPKAKYAFNYQDKFREIEICVPTKFNEDVEICGDLTVKGQILNATGDPYFTPCIVELVRDEIDIQCYQDNCTLVEWCITPHCVVKLVRDEVNIQCFQDNCTLEEWCITPHCVVEQIVNTTEQDCFRDNCTLVEWCICKDGNCTQEQIYQKSCKSDIGLSPLSTIKGECMCNDVDDLIINTQINLTDFLDPRQPISFNNLSSIYCYNKVNSGECLITNNQNRISFRRNIIITCIPNEGKFATDCGCGSVRECSKTWDTTSHLRSDVVGINAGELFPQQDPVSKQEGFYYNNPNGPPQKMDLFFYLGNQPIRDNQLSQLKSVWVLLWNYQSLIDNEVFIQVYTGPTFFTSRITFITDDWDRAGLTFVWISGNVNGVQLEEPDENVYNGVTRIELPYDSSQSIGPQSPTESLWGIKISSNSAWATNQLDMTVISAGYQLDCAREQVLFTFVEQFGELIIE